MSKTTASGVDSPFNDLDTPTLDIESPTLLHSISEHGGYAYVRMASLAAAGDIRAAEAVREMAWEQLHSGPWHSVLPVWRDAYSMACLHVAKHHYRNGEFKEALKALDMGIIMGGNLLRKDLDSAIGKVSEKARNIRVSDGNYQNFGNSEHRLVDHDFDVSEVSLINEFIASSLLALIIIFVVDDVVIILNVNIIIDNTTKLLFCNRINLIYEFYKS
jgi:lysine-specific demethylase 8